MKQKLIAASIVLAASISPIVNAGIAWDPDGGGALPTQDLGAFDWSQSSFVAEKGNTAILNWVTSAGACPTNSCDFTVYSHAYLGSTTSSSSVSNTPAGLNTGFEYTMVLGFTEKVTNVITANNFAAFKTDFSKPSFLEIYYDSSKDHQALSGSGFKDGQLILRASLGADANGNFTLDQPLTSVALDGFGTNDYTGQTTNTGNGSQGNLKFNVIDQDFAFFKDKVDTLGINYTNISIGLPYLQVDPSDCYTNTAEGSLGAKTDTECDTAHVNGLLNPTIQPLGAGFGGFVPVSSPGNTTLTGADANPDFVAQTDYNASLNGTPVPEPTSLLMLGMGLFGMLRLSSKRKQG